MSKIKSSKEILMEKLSKMEIKREEVERQRFIDIGRRLAGNYLMDERFDLISSLKEYKGEKEERYVREGLQSVLIHNLALPRNEEVEKNTRRAMEGISRLKEDKKGVAKIFNRLEEQFSYYKDEREMNYRVLKERFRIRLEESKKVIEEQLGLKVELEIDSQPEFQNEWKEVIGRLDAEYDEILEGYRKELEDIL